MVPDPPRRVPPDERTNATLPGSNSGLHGSGITDAIRHSGTAKEIARVTGVSVKTAERYRSGKSFPNVIGLTLLMRWSRRVAGTVIRLAGLDAASLDALQVRLEQDSHRDRAETSRIGGSPDARDETMGGVETGEVVGRHGSAL